MKRKVAIVLLTCAVISSSLAGCGMTTDNSTETQTEEMTKSEEITAVEETTKTEETTTVEEPTETTTEIQTSTVTSDDINKWLEEYKNSDDRKSMVADGGVLSDENLNLIAPYKSWNIKDLGNDCYLAQTTEATISMGFKKIGDKLYNSEEVIQKTYCSNCGGSGTIYTGGSVCGICGGTGQQYIPNAYYDNIMGWQGQWQMCSGCAGAGHFGGTSEICSNCHGYGNI